MKYVFRVFAVLLVLLAGCDEEAREDNTLNDSTNGDSLILDQWEDSGVPPDTSAPDTSVPDTAPDPEEGCVTEWREVFFEEPTPALISARHFDYPAMTSREEFVQTLGREPPASIRFPDEWLVFIIADGLGGTAELDTQILDISFCPKSGLQLEAATVKPENCETLELRGGLVSYAMFAIEPTFEDRHTQQGSTMRFLSHDCAETGASLGEACVLGSLCQPGLICAGLTRAQTGECVPASYHSTVTNTIATPIPDNDRAGVVSENVVTGLGAVDADILVTFQIHHPSPSDLVISLISPDGSEVVLSDHPTNDLIFPIVPKGLEGADSVNGTWQLKLVDDIVTNIGELDQWSIEVVSKDSP